MRASLAAALLFVCTCPAAVQLELDQPAAASSLGLQRTLVAAESAGARTLVAGRMGLVYHSDDQARSWKQAAVPVSVDLTALHFVSDRRGWMTGHDATVLTTADGGLNWTLQLDGRRAAREMLAYYQRSDLGAEPSLHTARDEARRFFEEDGARPFLDVCFLDDRTGFVVGAWGLIFRTTDGGDSWEPWMHRTDNPDALHLNAIALVDGVLWIAGERGLLLRLAADKDRFEAVPSPYGGSYFGISGQPGLLLLHGLHGNVFRSLDHGKSWQKGRIATSGGITGAIVDAGRILLTDSSGGLWLSEDRGLQYRALRPAASMPLYGLAWLPDAALLLVGAQGVARQDATR